MRRAVLPIYALFLLETLVWIAMVPLAPTFADEFGLSGVETGMILAAASLAALVVALMSVVSVVGRSLTPPRKRDLDQLPDSAPTTSSSR